jgi:hypothetical protein
MNDLESRLADLLKVGWATHRPGSPSRPSGAGGPRRRAVTGIGLSGRPGNPSPTVSPTSPAAPVGCRPGWSVASGAVPAGGPPGPGDLAAEVATRVAVGQLLAALTDRQRAVVVLRPSARPARGAGRADSWLRRRHGQGDDVAGAGPAAPRTHWLRWRFVALRGRRRDYRYARQTRLIANSR